MSDITRLAAMVILGAALSARAAAPPGDGLALHLPLTRDLRDHSPAKHAIQIVGAVRLEKDGAFFGGRKDWLEAPHISLNHRPFAIAVWIRETTEQRTVGLLEQFDLNRPNHHFTLMLRGNRQPYFGFYVNDLMSPLGISREQEWFHLVFQFTGKEREIWINGRLICSAPAPAYHGSTGVTAIGKLPRWSNVPGEDFVGHMRDFRIYQRVLTAEEIAVLSGLTPAPDPVGALDLPQLSARAVQNRRAMIQVLPENPALPFLQIGARELVVNGRAGQVYVLQTSSDLNAWRSVMTLTNRTGRVVLPLEGQQASEFFRVKVEGYEP